MAGLMLHATSGEVAVTVPSSPSGTTRTIMAVKPATNDRIKISSWGISFKGTSATDAPILCQLCRISQATLGSNNMATNANAIQKKNAEDQITVQTAAYVNNAGTSSANEPTVNAVIEEIEVHPQAGFVKIYPAGQEFYCSSADGSGAIGIRVVPGALTYFCTAEMDVEE